MEADADKMIIGMTRRKKRQIHLDLYFCYADKIKILYNLNGQEEDTFSVHKKINKYKSF